ncbi:MAG: hypothetical protein ACTHLY_13990, partial [Pseudolabrys sp.]
AIVLLAVRAPAQQTGSIAPSVPEPVTLDAQLRPYGYALLDSPMRQGAYYLVRARDPRGIESRVVIEADSGRIVSATPTTTVVRPPDYSPYYDANPRIISIPQAYDAAPVPQRQARVTRERQESPRAAVPQRPVRTAVREPVQEPVQPRRVVRQVVPPREQPARPAAVPPPPVDPSPRIETPQVAADPVPTPLPRAQALPRVLPSMPRPAVASDPVIPQAAPSPPTPRTRPRTVLAPPPYAEGPTPLKPLHHRDSKRFAPAPGDVPPASQEANAPDVLSGGEQHAAVPQNLPSIPSTPAVGSVPGAAVDAHANANEMRPEEMPPPGTVTLDVPAQ